MKDSLAQMFNKQSRLPFFVNIRLIIEIHLIKKLVVKFNINDKICIFETKGANHK
jgi:hypothetical protein